MLVLGLVLVLMLVLVLVLVLMLLLLLVLVLVLGIHAGNLCGGAPRGAQTRARRGTENCAAARAARRAPRERKLQRERAAPERRRGARPAPRGARRALPAWRDFPSSAAELLRGRAALLELPAARRGSGSLVGLGLRVLKRWFLLASGDSGAGSGRLLRLASCVSRAGPAPMAHWFARSRC